MSAFSNTFVALTSLAALAQAVPKVTPVLVDGDCAAYPLYGPGTGFVAHFTIEVNQCTDPATSKPCPIEGFGPSFEAKMVDGKEDPSQGYVTIVGIKDQAKVRMDCDPDTGVGVQAYDSEMITYNEVDVADTPESANLMWGLPKDKSIPIEPYHHIVDGEEQDGLFLGAQNVTTWAIKEHQHGTGAGSYPYWLFRLLGPENGGLKDGEYKTFLKVVDSAF